MEESLGEQFELEEELEEMDYDAYDGTENKFGTCDEDDDDDGVHGEDDGVDGFWLEGKTNKKKRKTWSIRVDDIEVYTKVNWCLFCCV